MSSDLLSSELERMLLESPDERLPSRHGKFDVQFNLLVESPPTTSPPVMSATITDLCSEPLFHNAYLSEEEETSASDTDDRSFSTGTSNSVNGDESKDAFEATLPERLADECIVVKEQCKHAQAVRLVAAGRPKVVQVKQLDSSQSRRRPSSSNSRLPSLAPTSRCASTQPRRRPSTILGSIVIAASEQSTPPLSRASSSGSSLPSLDDGSSTASLYAPSNPRTPNSVFQFDPFVNSARRHKSVAAVGHHDHTYDEYRPRPLLVTKRSDSYAPPIMTAPPTYTYIPQSYTNKTELFGRSADQRSISYSLPRHSQDAAYNAVRTTSRLSIMREDSNFYSHYQKPMKKSSPISNEVDSMSGFRWL